METAVRTAQLRRVEEKYQSEAYDVEHLQRALQQAKDHEEVALAR